MSLLPECDRNAQAQRWSLHIRQTPLAVIEWDMAGRVRSWNPAAELMFGYPAEEAIGQPIIELIVPPEAEVRNQVRLIAAGLTQEGESSRAEHENRRKDGSLILCRWFNTPLTDEAGHPLGVASMALDVTEIQRSTHALAVSEQRFRTVFEKAVDGIVIFSLEGLILDVNDSFAKIHGRTRKDLLGTNVWDLNSPESNSLVPERMRRMLAGETLHIELNLIHKDGHAFQTEASASLISYAEQPAILSFHRDITERKHVEEKLRESEKRFRLVSSSMLDIAYTCLRRSNDDYAIDWMVGATEALLGHSIEEIKAIRCWGDFVVEEDRPLFMKQVIGLSPGQSEVCELRMRKKDGGLTWFQSYAKCEVSMEDADHHQLYGALIDITQRKLAEGALRDSEARLQRAESVSGLGNWELDLTGGNIRGSLGAQRIYGLSGTDWILNEVEAVPLPEYRALLDECLKNLIEHGRPYHAEFKIRRPNDGQVLDIHSVAEYNPDRRIVFGVVHDITKRKLAEKEKEELQAQLQQAQKMESLGTLAGGIAHDMNNVLGAILGLASANLEIQSPGSPAFRAFDTISRAAIRGGEMVRSLLTFARRSQAEERELDLNAILREEIRLLERTTLSKVHLELDLEPGLHLVHGDVSALTNAVMNLCINAVDAMPETGTLTLRTRNVDRDWIELVVEDTGVGMSKEVLKRALEPFFTTKATGKGTGLGLSMVYSTVNAHQGQIDIQSELGRGTAVTLRFPACGFSAQATKQDEGPRSESSPRMMKVLLVDDDELIQSSMETILQTLGHTVVTKASGEAALASIEAGFEPDVVILDMNMPGLGGSGTLPRLRALRPAVPVLLSTGRTDQTALDLAEAHPHVTLLPKPFSMIELQKRLEPFRLG